jgi:predicted tellurium resistance membrane protein TerC
MLSGVSCYPRAYLARAKDRSVEWISQPEIWISLFTLTALEIVLGIDNIVFISILAGKLPPEQRDKARRVGLFLAMGTRILLLLSISWVIGLTKPIFTLLEEQISGRDLILLFGGLFLLGKSTFEIHERLEGHEAHNAAVVHASFVSIIVQILLLDVVFSLDSVITAVGTADHVEVMIAAVVVAVLVMLVASGPISHFVEGHPTVKILALSFLLLIGMSLVAEALDQHIPKGYIYFAMGFSVLVEALNLRIRQHTNPVQLHQAYPAVVADSDSPAGTA